MGGSAKGFRSGKLLEAFGMRRMRGVSACDMSLSAKLPMNQLQRLHSLLARRIKPQCDHDPFDQLSNRPLLVSRRGNVSSRKSHS